MPTIAHGCAFYLGLISITTNVLFTLAVFYIAIGPIIAGIIAISLIVSLGVVRLLRNIISSLASDMQKTKVDALARIDGLWDRSHFGTKEMYLEERGVFSTYSSKHFKAAERYMILEQIVSCAPIILSVLILIAALQAMSASITASIVGVLVAVLPRTLQLFGNIHALNMYFSQYFLIRSKVKNLISFSETLNHQDVSNSVQTDKINITVLPSNVRMAAADLVEKVSEERLSCGRYLVSGSNGSGKSSLLKVLKAKSQCSAMLTPSTNFLEINQELSTGETQLEQLRNLANLSPKILLLDEWDANLDKDNTNIINKEIEKISSKIAVIEVRHKYEGFS
ncbi:FeS assembly ATPase SufC [compost metagenome]